MKKLILFLMPLVAFCLTALALAGGAEAQSKAREAYLCKMSYVSRDNFIPKEMAFWVGADRSVEVFDAYIRHYAKKPLAAQIVEDSKARLQFRWQLDKVDAVQEGSATGGTKMPPITYNAIYRKQTGMVTVRVQLVGFGNTPSAKGMCRPIKR